MHVPWIYSWQTLVVGAAVWLACAPLITVASPPVERAVVDNGGGKRKSLAAENPFVKQRASAATRELIAAAIDPGAPVIYRLPNVALYVPVHVDVPASSRPWTMLTPSADADCNAHSRAAEPLQDATDESEQRTQRSPMAGSRVKTLLPVPHRSLASDHESTSTQIERVIPSPRIGTSLSVPPQPFKHDVLPFEPPQQASPQITPTTNELTSQLLPAVQRGYGLAQRGALYAAQTEFVQVLRRIAQAKDATTRSGDHSRALAAGLRAIDEAEDFVPAGIQLEADIDVQIVASSHRTPVVRDADEDVLPHAAAQLYYRYAEQQLAAAVSGEQAGSMALHGLGKIYALLAARNDDDMQLTQRATAMYSAALGARADNHLAANELGVLLCRSGRPEEAVRLFTRTIDGAPSSLASHNLAVAQRKLGLMGRAAANEQESQRLAAWERATGAVSRRAGVEWVSPREMTRVAQPAPLAPAMHSATQPNSPSPTTNAAVAPVPSKSPWQRALEFAKSLSRPRSNSNSQTHEQATEVRVARPLVPPATPGHTQWQ